MAAISTFKSKVIGGGARANQFEIILTTPPAIAGLAANLANFSFMCNASELPGSIIETAPLMFRGRTVKFAGERQFADWSITIINDTTFKLHEAMETWMATFDNVVTGAGILSGYTSTFTVNQLDRNKNTLHSYEMQEAWPVNISPVELKFDANNQIETFQVTFAYQKWKSMTGSSIIAGADAAS